MKNCRLITVVGLLILFGSVSVATESSAVTLIQRSNGLSVPDMEEGRTELELGDINGDGHLDIVSVGDHGSPYVNSGEHGIMTWLGDGTGNWSVIQVGNFGYGGVGLGDLNRDGHLDAAWGIHHDWASGDLGSTLIGAAIGDGTGSGWTSWGVGLATTGETWGMFATDLADFDVDGRLDLISQSFGGSNGIRIYRNEGSGSWTSGYVLSGGTVRYTIETGDFNADGYPDFGCTRTGGTIYLGDGEFGFTPLDTGLPSGTRSAIDIGDVDDDGHDDVLLAISDGGVHACRFDPTGMSWIDLSSGLPTTGSYDMVQFGDIDGDGITDIVTYDSPTGRVYLGDGEGIWTGDATWTMPSPGTGSAMRVDGDIDHDGRDDIVIAAVMSGFPFYRNQLRVYSAWSEPAVVSARVTAPNGGESLLRGSIRKIRWTAAIPPAEGEATVDIRVSSDGEDGPWNVVATALPNNGTYEWLVDGGPASSDCWIEIDVVTSSGTTTARSAAAFTILDPIASAAPPMETIPRVGAGAGGLHAFPNPAATNVTFQWPIDLPNEGVLDIFTVDGQRVHREWVHRSSADVIWERTPRVLPGVYFATLRCGDWFARTRVVLTGKDLAR